MLAKLQACGVGASFLNFLDAYLAPRKGQVVVQGSYSECFEIANSVFQGTVLGPPLWNTFFADVGAPASSSGGREAMFADDLNVFQEFDRLMPANTCQEQLEQCKERVHAWGQGQQGQFRCLQGTHGSFAPLGIIGGIVQAFRLHSRRQFENAVRSRASTLEDSS